MNPEREKAESRRLEQGVESGTNPSAQQLLHLLVKGATQYALVLFSPENRITYWNDGARQMFGYAEREILGQDAAGGGTRVRFSIPR